MLLSFGMSCSIKPDFKQIHFYTLEYPPKILSDSRPVVPAVIRFERFKAAPMIESNHMLYRRSNVQMDAYVYHKWRAAPSEMVMYFLARDFRESKLFKGIFTANQNLKATHRIEGTVEEFYELDEPSIWEAVLSINIVLLTETEPDISARVLFQKRYITKIPCLKNTPKAFAEAMSSAMSALSEAIIADVYDRLFGKK